MNIPNHRETRGGRGAGMAGGSLLAFSLVAGVVIGTVYGQPSIGFLAGLGGGILLFLLVWWLGDHRG